MVYVGIDVAKDKHDCFIVNSEGEVLYDVFTIQNNISGFEDLLFKIKTAEQNPDKVKVGLEATGHYSCNILGFLKTVGLQTIVINPLYTSLSRKSMTLRKTKTDKFFHNSPGAAMCLGTPHLLEQFRHTYVQAVQNVLAPQK